MAHKHKTSSSEFFSKDYYFGKKLSNYLNYSQWDNDRFWKSIINTVKKYNINGRVLDVGCAFGFLLKRLPQFFHELYGIDISSFAIQKAKEQIPSAQLKVIDINKDNLPYPDKYFDLITVLDVLEHTESIENSLRKIIDKLKDDGYLIISAPIKDTWAGRVFSFFDKDKSHISVPKRKELFDIIDRVGLKVIEERSFLNLIYFKLKGIPVDVELVLKK